MQSVAGTCRRPATYCRCTAKVCRLWWARASCLPLATGVHWQPAVTCWHGPVSHCLSVAHASGTCRWPTLTAGACQWPAVCRWRMLVTCHTSPVHTEGLPPVAHAHLPPTTTRQHGTVTCSLFSACTGGLPHVASALWRPASCQQLPVTDVSQRTATCPWPVLGASHLSPVHTGSMHGWTAAYDRSVPAACHLSLVHTGRKPFLAAHVSGLPPVTGTCWQHATRHQHTLRSPAWTGDLRSVVGTCWQPAT